MIDWLQFIEVEGELQRRRIYEEQRERFRVPTIEEIDAELERRRDNPDPEGA